MHGLTSGSTINSGHTGVAGMHNIAESPAGGQDFCVCVFSPAAGEPGVGPLLLFALGFVDTLYRWFEPAIAYDPTVTGRYGR